MVIMAEQNNNRSLFLYTGLIFVVAILMIVIAFFAQNNVMKKQPIQSDDSTSITAKAAQLSEDNRILLERNKILEAEIFNIKTENDEMAAQFEIYEMEQKNSDILLEVYDCLYNRKKKKARELLDTITVEELTKTQKKFYDIMVKKSK